MAVLLIVVLVVIVIWTLFQKFNFRQWRKYIFISLSSSCCPRLKRLATRPKYSDTCGRTPGHHNTMSVAMAKKLTTVEIAMVHPFQVKDEGVGEGGGGGGGGGVGGNCFL